jgi:holo-[acyl-carrier protein] synthase
VGAEYEFKMPYAIGIDLTEVDDVRDSISRFGDRYLERVYTASERADCGTDPRRLAARFAAKEAAMKALAPADRLPWHSISVVRDAAGRPSLALSGEAAELASRLGVSGISVSLTHERSVAAAIVLTEAA